MKKPVPVSEDVRDQMWRAHDRRGRIEVLAIAALFVVVLIADAKQWHVPSWIAVVAAVAVGVVAVADTVITARRTGHVYSTPIEPHPEILRRVEESDRGIDKDE